MRTLLFILLGYLSGSVLYARVFVQLFHKGDALEESRDKNPGAANAFMYGGFWCGVLTLLCDLLKGIVPVYLYFRGTASADTMQPLAAAFVLLAPVIGHLCPVFYGFRGGKGISVTFGSLLGLFPHWIPAVCMAGCFIFFSLVLRIIPHFYRTAVTYICTGLLLYMMKESAGICMGYGLIAVCVCLHLHHSTEERERLQVKFLWMH